MERLGLRSPMCLTLAPSVEWWWLNNCQDTCYLNELEALCEWSEG